VPEFYYPNKALPELKSQAFFSKFCNSGRFCNILSFNSANKMCKHASRCWTTSGTYIASSALSSLFVRYKFILFKPTLMWENWTPMNHKVFCWLSSQN